MNCPVCEATLRAVQKHGIEVDICPDCKGVWLDRGELDKMIQMAASDGPAQQAAPDRPAERDVERPRVHEDDRKRRDDDHYDKDRGHDRGYSQGSGHQKRRGSWLSDVLGSFGGDD